MCYGSGIGPVPEKKSVLFFVFVFLAGLFCLTGGAPPKENEKKHFFFVVSFGGYKCAGLEQGLTFLFRRSVQFREKWHRPRPGRPRKRKRFRKRKLRMPSVASGPRDGLQRRPRSS
jgi:hypothetical protein